MKANPLDKVKPGKVDKHGKVRFLNEDEEIALRTALDEREEAIRINRADTNEWSKNRIFADHLKPAVLLSLNTGLRRGELLNLKWADVHIDRKNLTVVAETSKTGTTRHIPLNDEALYVLKE